MLTSLIGQAIAGFSATTNAQRRYDGDRNALWFVPMRVYGIFTQTPNRFFIIAILSAISIGLQNFYFASSAAILTAKLRTLVFKAILRQDSKQFTLNSYVNLMSSS